MRDMPDSLSDRYADLLSGSYDCVDRIVLNAYFRMGHDPGGFRLWWRALTGSDETLENAHLMRMAGRFQPSYPWLCQGEHYPCGGLFSRGTEARAEEYLAKSKVTRGLFLILVGRAQAGRQRQPPHRAKEADALRQSLLISYPRS